MSADCQAGRHIYQGLVVYAVLGETVECEECGAPIGDQPDVKSTLPPTRLDAEALAAFMWRKKFEMEHVRRFTADMQPGLNPYRNSLCQIEGDLEEYLVEAGYDRKWFAAYDPETQEDR